MKHIVAVYDRIDDELNVGVFEGTQFECVKVAVIEFTKDEHKNTIEDYLNTYTGSLNNLIYELNLADTLIKIKEL